MMMIDKFGVWGMNDDWKERSEESEASFSAQCYFAHYRFHTVCPVMELEHLR
jgi:hypothetical protein